MKTGNRTEKGSVPLVFIIEENRSPYGTFELATFPILLYDIFIFSWDSRKSPAKRQVAFTLITEVAV